VQLVRIVFGDEPKAFSAIEIMRRLTDSLAEIDKLMLSASQQRKSRAGYSYEHHIEAMLNAALIPFEKQVILENKKRPDFILPSLSYATRLQPVNQQGLILSAKTTLRERWKQVEREKGDRDLYLTTVDENIPASTIEDMARIDVQLVVPEGLLSESKDKRKKNEYSGHPNVLTFKEFCESVVKPRMRFWK
uniref:type II restriction endonuclease n=1 Tax=uncultured Thalassospira sp. TaxID=404382 RepID=UPI002596C9F2